MRAIGRARLVKVCTVVDSVRNRPEYSGYQSVYHTLLLLSDVCHDTGLLAFFV